MKSILSTKVLTSSQKNLLSASNLRLTEYNAISISFLKFSLKNDFDAYIITSQNAALALKPASIARKRCFCVGEKTKALLYKLGYPVTENAPSAASLASILATRYRQFRFLFLCGNLRRDELPRYLSKKKVHYTEVVVYQTQKNKRYFDHVFDAILFFSPSGVSSFIDSNAIGNAMAFCIGKTTASEVKKYTDSFLVAEEPTIENTILKMLDFFKAKGANLPD